MQLALFSSVKEDSSMTRQEVDAALRQSLGLPPKQEPQPTLPEEGNIALMIKTDRFIDPVTRQRTHVTYFRVLNSMKLAKQRKETSRFYFNEVFLESLRSGYLKRLDFDFCLYLDRETQPLARFLY